MTRLRTSTSPSPGSRTSTSTNRKSSGWGQPCGRRTRCHSRPVVIGSRLSWGLAFDDGAQLATQDLAGCRHRDLIDATNLAELLVRNDAFVDEREHLIRVGVVLQYDERNRELARRQVALADDGCVGHARMLEEDLFEVARIDVVALVDQHVLLAVDDGQIAVFVDDTDVTRAQPAVAVEHLG